MIKITKRQLAYALLINALALGGAAAESMSQACDDADFQTTLHATPTSYAARAVWLNASLIQWPGVTHAGRFRLYYGARGRILAQAGSKVLGADGYVALEVFNGAPPAADAERFKYLAAGVRLQVGAGDRARLPALHRQQLVLVQESPGGDVREASAVQSAGALDALYADAAQAETLGVSITHDTRFALWAPSAQQVLLCTYEAGKLRADAVDAMQRDKASGVWSISKPGDLSGRYYRYVVDVFVNGAGLMRNRVTDPYSLSLNTDSQRSYIGRLDAPGLTPAGWEQDKTPARIAQASDMAVYELHVRDFSINDASVRPAWRGKYLAFTEARSHGMQHLAALSRAGITDVHLLPIFDFANLPEAGCVTPHIGGAPDSEEQQAAISAVRERDCYNWGYDPFHFNAPEGSYATDAADGATRILELRRMVQALHHSGLRVGMDVVYNHTSAAGQKPAAVLDRIVPGYYQRLNAAGEVENSTCCANTATENRMMDKLMRDSVALWAREYHIDSFRFDLMGHQPRAAMEAVQVSVNLARGAHVPLLGEGWNFGEVANGARFVQAAQGALNGSGIGTFSDRARDAVRGGGPADSGARLLEAQGWVQGQLAPAEMMVAADMIRVGLAGSLRDYTMQTHDGQIKSLAGIDYHGQPAGYVSAPGEVVNYVENHDNQTLFDNNVLKLPRATSREDRVRVQMLALATTIFSQGIAYFHAGVDILRSKSLDRDSFNSGDWFNRLDWTYRDNYFGTGLPPKEANGANYAVIKPLLGQPQIKPAPQDIVMARDMFRDLLRIRSSSSLWRMSSAQEVQQRLHFANLGPQQNPAVIVGRLNGAGYPGAQFKRMIYFINAAPTTQDIAIAEERERAFVLHPVHLEPQAADRRPAQLARYDSASGRFSIPARTALVFVEK